MIPLKNIFSLLISAGLFLFFLPGCSKPGHEISSPTEELTLTISPGILINVPYNGIATFSWVTNGTTVTVNGITNNSGTFSSPPLQNSTIYTVTAYSASGATKVVQVAVNLNSTVYISGFDDGWIVNWKDGVETLMQTTQSYSGNSTGIAIKDTDVYISGYISGSYTSNGAMYWKNNIKVELLPGNPQPQGQARAITISGPDVYIAGHIYANLVEAVYWKNEVKTVLIASYAVASAQAITVSGGDIYVAGFVGDSSVFWKNGVRTTLSNRGMYGYSRAEAIAVSGTDVYVAGTEDRIALYWKNGIKYLLPTDGYAEVNAIAISGTDVYIIGSDDQKAVIWKNGVKIILCPYYSNAFAIDFDRGDVYVTGFINSSAVFWKNGNATILRSGGISTSVKGTGIKVIPH